MITVEQIQLLESRVTKAVRKIETLQDENGTLRDRLARYEKRIEELEILINEFKDSQNDIEQGILNALSQLDELEDQVTGDSESTPTGQSDSTPGEATGNNRSTSSSQGDAGNPGSSSKPDGGKSGDKSQETSDANSEAVHASDVKQQPEAAPHGEAGESERSGETDPEEEQGVELDIF